VSTDAAKDVCVDCGGTSFKYVEMKTCCVFQETVLVMSWMERPLENAWVEAIARVECAFGLLGPKTALDLTIASTTHPEIVALAAGLYGLVEVTNK